MIQHKNTQSDYVCILRTFLQSVLSFAYFIEFAKPDFMTSTEVQKYSQAN
jgi:hypothetical protein